MGKEIVVLNIEGEILLLEGEALNRNQKIEIESIVESAFEDNPDILEDMNNFDLADWVVEEVKKNLGIELTFVKIGAEFQMKRP